MDRGFPEVRVLSTFLLPYLYPPELWITCDEIKNCGGEGINRPQKGVQNAPHGDGQVAASRLMAGKGGGDAKSCFIRHGGGDCESSTATPTVKGQPCGIGFYSSSISYGARFASLTWALPIGKGRV